MDRVDTILICIVTGIMDVVAARIHYARDSALVPRPPTSPIALDRFVQCVSVEDAAVKHTDVAGHDVTLCVVVVVFDIVPARAPVSTHVSDTSGVVMSVAKIVHLDPVTQAIRHAVLAVRCSTYKCLCDVRCSLSVVIGDTIHTSSSAVRYPCDRAWIILASVLPICLDQVSSSV